MSRIEVGAYFYPLTTRCPERKARAEELGYSVVDETLLAQQAVPLFEGHDQPRKYCLGEKEWTRWDDGDIRAVARQVELANTYNLDFFVFDTYIGQKGGRVRREMIQPLDENFLQLEEARNLKFALMFVFGSPRVVLPVPPIENFEEPNRYYDLNKSTARIVIDDCVTKYWPRSNYLTINGKPYISIFTSDLSAHGQAKKDALRQLLGEMHEYSLKKYQVEPYIVGVVRKVSSGHDLASAGANALTGYAFLPEFGADAPSVQAYCELLAKRKTEWREMKDAIGVSVVPPAVTGWDASPRGQSQYQLSEVAGCYPYTPVVVGSSPENFATMLRDTLAFVRENVSVDQRYGIVCAWNEITEGAALLPEVREGNRVDFGFLEALERVER